MLCCVARCAVRAHCCLSGRLCCAAPHAGQRCAQGGKLPEPDVLCSCRFINTPMPPQRYMPGLAKPATTSR